MFQPSPILTVDPLQEMGHLRNVISQEAISMQGIVNSISNLIPSLQSHFQNFVKGFSKSEPAVQLKGNERDFVRLIDDRVYLNLAPLLAYVPEGLEVSYIDYLDVLTLSAEHSHRVAQDALNNYSVMLAQIITNRELKKSMLPLDSQYVAMEKERTRLQAAMAKCFKTGSSRAESTYGDVVSRNAEWVDVFKMVEKLNHVVNSIRRDDLHKSAENIDRQLQTIIKQIRNHEFEGVGPEVTTNLSNGAYQCGAELEFFAAVYFRSTVMNNAVADTMKKVTEILKELDQSK